MTFNNHRPTIQSSVQSRRLASPLSIYNNGSSGSLGTTSEYVNSSTFVKMIPILNKNFHINTNRSSKNPNNNSNNSIRPLSMINSQNQCFSLTNQASNLMNRICFETSKDTNNFTSRIMLNRKNGFASTFAIDENTMSISTLQHQQQQLQRPICFNSSNQDVRFARMAPGRLGNMKNGVDLNRINLKSLPAPQPQQLTSMTMKPKTITKSQQSDEYSSFYGEESATNTSSESCSNVDGYNSIKKNIVETTPYQKQIFSVPKSSSQQPLNKSNLSNNRQRSSSSNARNRYSINSINSNYSFNASCVSPAPNDNLKINLNNKLKNDSKNLTKNNFKFFRSPLIKKENSIQQKQTTPPPPPPPLQQPSSYPNAVKIRFESRQPSVSKRFSIAASSTPTIDRREHQNENGVEDERLKVALTPASKPKSTTAPIAVYDENSSSDSLKNSTSNKFYKKSVSLYYDSGIGADAISLNNFSTVTKEEFQTKSQLKYYTSSHHDITTIKSPASAKKKNADTLNPAMIRKLYSSTKISRSKVNNTISNKTKLKSSSSTSDSSSSTTTGSSSSTTGMSSSSILSDRVRHKLDTMLKSNNLKIVSISKSKKVAPVEEEKSTANDNKDRKNILLKVKKQSPLNPSYRKLNSCSDLVKSSASTTISPTHQIVIESEVISTHKKSNESINDDCSRADFTPTISRNPIKSKAHLLKRKVGIPPPPIINSNTSIGISSLKEKSCSSPMSVLNSSYSNLASTHLSSIHLLNSNTDVSTATVLSSKMKETITQHLKNHSMSTRNLFIENFLNNKNNKMRKKFESTNSINFSQQKSNVNLSISNESYCSPNQCQIKSNY